MKNLEDVKRRRRSFRLEWLRSIYEISDIELQRCSWLDRDNGGTHWSFFEFVQCYFDCFGAARHRGYDWALGQACVTGPEVAAVIQLHRTLEQYAPPGDDCDAHEAILADPHWAAIVSEAQRARQRLLALLKDSDERRILNGGYFPLD